MEREGHGGRAARDERLERGGAPGAADEIDTLVGPDVGDPQHGLQQPILEDADVERADGIGRGRRDARRVVFGRKGRYTRLSLALSASCAVPGYFAPVVIQGDTYVDGGIQSPTNADLLASADLDLVVVVSPMSGAANPRSVDGIVRRRAGRTLDRELSRLRARGTEVIAVEPGPDVVRHMGFDFVNRESSLAIARAAFLDTGRQLVDAPPGIRERLQEACARRDLNPHALAGTGT